MSRCLVLRGALVLATTLDAGYEVGSSLVVKLRQGAAYLEWWRKHIGPVYQRLLEEGTVVSYGVDIQHIISESPFTRSTWYVVPDAAALDKVRAAFGQEFGGRSPEEISAIFGESIDATTELGERRTNMSQVLHYVTQ